MELPTHSREAPWARWHGGWIWHAGSAPLVETMARRSRLIPEKEKSYLGDNVSTEQMGINRSETRLCWKWGGEDLKQSFLIGAICVALASRSPWGTAGLSNWHPARGLVVDSGLLASHHLALPPGSPSLLSFRCLPPPQGARQCSVAQNSQWSWRWPWGAAVEGEGVAGWCMVGRGKGTHIVGDTSSQSSMGQGFWVACDGRGVATLV